MYNYIMKDRDIKNKSPDKQKRIIQTYVEKVLIFNNSIDIHLIVTKNGADEGNRTPVASLGSWSSTIEPHPQMKVLLYTGLYYYIRFLNTSQLFHGFFHHSRNLPACRFGDGCYRYSQTLCKGDDKKTLCL